VSSNPATALKQSPPDIANTARESFRYSPDAFDFLREGLDFTVQRTHGPAVETMRKILQWLEDKELDISRLPEAFEEGLLPTSLAAFIEENGGPVVVQERLNLHVGGKDLCWGLRDLAIERWGLMAPAVLHQWGIKSTQDFGRMVFSLVEQGLLQKQPHDQLSDFANVFDFAEAFERTYRIEMSRNVRNQKQSE
jgi:uncharacterized repeat protein (TIGR04138 family)